MRPLNLGETLDASIKIVAARWRVLAIVMVVVAVPIHLLSVLVISSTTDTYEVGSAFATSTNTTYSDESAYVGGQVVIALLTILSYLLGTVACYRAIADTYLDRPTSVGSSLRFAASRLGATLWLSALMFGGLILGFLALIVPGIWLFIAWSVAFPVMLVEGVGGAAALKRSFALVKDHWWATFGRFAVAYILVSIVGAVAGFVLLLPAEAIVDDTSTGALILEQLANLLVSLLTTPVLAAVATLVYFDLRVRKEGFDLAVLAERMGGALAAGPAPGAPPPDVPRTPQPATTGWAPPARARDAFGNPIPPSSASPPTHAPDPTALPGGWAPPVAPTPQRPSRPPTE